MKQIDTIIFDLGGVLIDWNPEYVFLDVFNGGRKKMQWFFDNICTSDWNENQDDYKGHDVGVIAQEIQEVLPEIVTERKDGYLAVRYEKLVPLLIEGIKELTNKVELLENEIKKLKEK